MKKINILVLSLVLAITTMFCGCSSSPADIDSETQQFSHLDKQETVSIPEPSFDQTEKPLDTKDKLIGLWRLESVTIGETEENFLYFGSAYNIEADGKITDYYFFEQMHEQIDWTVDEDSVITLDSASQSHEAQLTFETRNGKEYMVWDFSDQISVYYRTSVEEFEADEEAATKNDDSLTSDLIENVWVSQQHVLPSGAVEEVTDYSFIFYPDFTFKRIYEGYPYYGRWEVVCGVLNLYYDDESMGYLNLPIVVEETNERLALKIYGTFKENEGECWQYASGEEPKFSEEDLIGLWHAVYVNNVDIVDEGQAYEFKDDGTIIMYGSFEPYDTGRVEWELSETEFISFYFEEGEGGLKVSLLEHEGNQYLYFYNGDVEWIFVRSTYDEFKDRADSN